MTGTFLKNNNKRGSLTTSEVEMMFNFQNGNGNGNKLVGQGFITFSDNKVAIIQMGCMIVIFLCSKWLRGETRQQFACLKSLIFCNLEDGPICYRLIPVFFLLHSMRWEILRKVSWSRGVLGCCIPVLKRSGEDTGHYFYRSFQR